MKEVREDSKHMEVVERINSSLVHGSIQRVINSLIAGNTVNGVPKRGYKDHNLRLKIGRVLKGEKVLGWKEVLTEFEKLSIEDRDFIEGMHSRATEGN